MWVKSENGGRVNLALVASLTAANTGVWIVRATLVDGSTLTLSSGHASKADAETEIDRLLLDGS